MIDLCVIFFESGGWKLGACGENALPSRRSVRPPRELNTQGLLAERMEKYARASGHPRLVELLSRHASDQKDKFTLSDDEDQV